jgi:gliding motility-associated protein GldL
MSLYKIVRSKAYKNFMSKLYGWGAAAVILGALFKILHITGADTMLIVGMGTEALIFFCSAFEPLHKEFDWALVYPELGISDEASNKGTVSQQLDNMLEKAKVGPELIESLSAGMRNLSDTARNISKTTDVAFATDGYVSNLAKAKDAIGNLTGVYEKSANAISASSDMQVKNMQEVMDIQKSNTQKLQETLASSTDMQMKSAQELINSQKIHALKLQETLSTSTDMQIKSAQELFDVQKQHAQKMQTALTSTSEIQVKNVQEMFEMQKLNAQKIQDTHLQNVQKIDQIQEQGTKTILDNYKKIEDSYTKLANSMNETVQEAQLYKVEVDKLSKQVAQINAIYSNMLAAMTTK